MGGHIAVIGLGPEAIQNQFPGAATVSCSPSRSGAHSSGRSAPSYRPSAERAPTPTLNAANRSVSNDSHCLESGYAQKGFRPRRRSSAQGFRADWSVTSYNTRARDQIAGSGDAPIESMSVTLIDPVNVYVQTDRAVKYGVLFVLLTFTGFFMFELIKRLRIHPIQYLLVGLSLALFFLMLLSLSEHVVFALAYLAASAGCIGLLGFYLSFVLRSWKRGLGFAVLLSALYAALYGLLLSEDNALILGSILLFGILATIMILTRRIDWYAVGDAWQPLRDKSAADVAEVPAANAPNDIG